MAIDCPTALSEANDALHALLTGSKEVEVQGVDRRVRYAQADESKLRAYIAELEAKCGTSATDCAKRRRPIGVRF